MWKLFILLAAITVFLALAADNEIPEYIKPCKRGDPELTECIKNSLEHLRHYLAKGIPEIEIPSAEPFIMDQLTLQLTEGPQGYKITMRNIELYGSTDFKLKSLTLSENGEPFKARIFVPKLTIKSKYTSSGVLLVIPASGGGDFFAEFEGAVTDLLGSVSYKNKNDNTFMHIDNLGLKMTVDKVNMSIANAFHNNRILTDATNLFLSEHGTEVVSIMQPQLEKKLALEFGRIINSLLKNVPQNVFYID